jgi:SHS2 domain-containing protein
VGLPQWEEFEHTADVGLRVRGATLADLFANAARGMLDLAVGGEKTVQEQERVALELQAPDIETLLVDWLTELLYLMEDGSFIPAGVEVVAVEANSLRAEAIGGAGADLHRHIKAVTYHDLSIEKTEGGYQATVVFDV